MTEQWKELKQTITELRDNNGTGTQQEICKFLVNLMNVLEKQMAEEHQKDKADLCIKQELPATPQPKVGHWIDDEFGSKCSCCGIHTHLDKFDRPMKFKYCSMCGAKMQEREDKE